MPISSKQLMVGAITVLVGVCLAAGCSPQSQKGEGGAGEGQTGGDATTQTVQAWSFDGDCVVCHTTEGATMSEGALGAQVHATQAAADCTTCHTDQSALAAAHEGKTASDPLPKKLKKTEVSVETCQAAGCHDESKDEMLALTAAYTDLTDSKGTQVNPHDVIGLTPGHEDITCSNCHKMHDEEGTPADVCVSCHHAGVYECNTCH